MKALLDKHTCLWWNLNAHQDPFDRLLIVQSQLEKMPLLTADLEIVKYAVSVVW
jgi:PIN domain nuclease of toxin-antitoxin system